MIEVRDSDLKKSFPGNFTVGILLRLDELKMNLNEFYEESASSVNKAIFEPVWKCKSISSIKSNHFHVLTILNFQPYRSETIKYQPEITGREYPVRSRRWNWKFRKRHFWNPNPEFLLHSSYSFWPWLSSNSSGWDLASSLPWKNCEKHLLYFSQFFHISVLAKSQALPLVDSQGQKL